VLLIIGVDAGNPIGEHRGHQREVKDVLPGHVGMLRVSRKHAPEDIWARVDRP
jgi:hypothetical protein